MHFEISWRRWVWNKIELVLRTAGFCERTLQWVPEHGKNDICRPFQKIKAGKHEGLFCGLYKMRPELFWDRDIEQASPEIMIERAINFGGFDFIKEVQERYGMDQFVHTLKHNRNLGKKAVNYWCLRLGIDRNRTKTFQMKRIWEPFR